jgi:hypothetical protein
MNHATMPTFDSHHAHRDSDAVRASQAFRRLNRSTTLGRRPSGAAFSSIETRTPVLITPTPRS